MLHIWGYHHIIHLWILLPNQFLPGITCTDAQDLQELGALPFPNLFLSVRIPIELFLIGSTDLLVNHYMEFAGYIVVTDGKEF